VTEIQQNRWDQLVRRSANIVGGGSQVNDTLNELFPVLDVERVPGELLFLGGTRIAFGSARQLAVAARFSRVELFNPAGSRNLIAVTRAIISSTANTVIRWQLGSTQLGGDVGNSALRDTRTGVVVLPIGVVMNEDTAGGIAAFGQMLILADTPYTLEDENTIAVLFPGTGIQVVGAVANVEVNCTFYWRERVFEPSETNF